MLLPLKLFLSLFVTNRGIMSEPTVKELENLSRDREAHKKLKRLKAIFNDVLTPRNRPVTKGYRIDA